MQFALSFAIYCYENKIVRCGSLCLLLWKWGGEIRVSSPYGKEKSLLLYGFHTIDRAESELHKVKREKKLFHYKYSRQIGNCVRFAKQRWYANNNRKRTALSRSFNNRLTRQSTNCTGFTTPWWWANNSNSYGWNTFADTSSNENWYIARLIYRYKT